MTPLYAVLGYARTLAGVDYEEAGELLHLTPVEVRQAEMLIRQPDKEVPYIQEYAETLLMLAGTSLPKWASNILIDVIEKNAAQTLFERDKIVSNMLDSIIPAWDYDEWLDLIISNHAEHIEKDLWKWHFPKYQNARDLNVFVFNQWCRNSSPEVELIRDRYAILTYPYSELNFKPIINYSKFGKNLLMVLLKEVFVNDYIYLTFNPTELTGKRKVVKLKNNIEVEFREI